jgi:hypothetical protein
MRCRAATTSGRSCLGAGARAARRVPAILDRLAEGAVNLTTVKLLAKRLTADNHLEVLESARGMSR